MWYVACVLLGVVVGAGLYRRFGASASAKFAQVETAVRNLELSVSSRLQAVEEALGLKK